VSTPPIINPIATPAGFLCAYVIARARAKPGAMDGAAVARDAIAALNEITKEIHRINEEKP
jgi:hypothetical protein